MGPPLGNGFRHQQQQQIDEPTAISRRPNSTAENSNNQQQQQQQQQHGQSTTAGARRDGHALRWRRLQAAAPVRGLSALLCLVAVFALSHASATAQRENTRSLPIHSGGLADGGRVGFGADSGDGSGSIAAFNVPCPTGMFRCNDGKCITSLWVCNYQKDCEGGEDEQQSCPPPECEPGQISCGQYVFNKTYCIPPHYRCDMTEDCDDKSDEAQCNSTLGNPHVLYYLHCPQTH